ncbi:hypothetical protein BGZ95_008319 [Linnemannia exigua]|uniref:Uncharacterized protein n=1 Tax=Linnemannia exigua TaxID=604196 RepID=A0AAD4DEC9_9FUNG|nr:hypothetical protein BGZ95_008319 [Linnemannia exigua]
MQLTIGEANAVPLLEDLLSSCLLKAGLEETVEGLWNRVRARPDGQQEGCVTNTNVTVDNSYSWILVASLDGGLLEVVFMEGDLGVTFDECVPEESQDPNCPMYILPPDNNDSNNKVSGSMIRWAFVDPNDGSLPSIWPNGPSIQAMSATFGSTNKTLTALSFMAMMDAIDKFAESWEKVAKAIGSSSTTEVKSRVCLGFDQLDYKATSSVMQGVSIKNLPLLVEDVVDLEALPNRDDIKRLMTFTNPGG